MVTVFSLDTQSDRGEKEKEKLVEDKVEPAPIKRVLKLNVSEWPYIAAGVFASMGIGAYPLVFAVLISEVLNVRIFKLYS